MRLAVVSLFYILTEITVRTIGLDCHHYTSFELKRSEDVIDIEQIFATITTKSCKDHERCSRLQIKDTANETYTALDCLDRSICENPESWCHRFTGSLFTSCDITCCDGDLCAEMNTTKSVVTKNPKIEKATCSIFTPFQVNIESREVTEVYSPLETKICELDEICGGIILTDRNNRTHHASACVNHGHCKNPDMFCTGLTEGTNWTFIDCELKCCNESFCLDEQNSNTMKCFEYNSFSLAGDEVKSSSHTTEIKTCKKDELCSRGTFTDRENNTHISLDCIAKSVCNNPGILCQHFSESNQQSPFVQCNIECCIDNLCYSDSIPPSMPPSSTSSTTPTTVATPSSTTKLQTHIGIILQVAILFYICLNIILQ
jgi:hypothetical protein